MKTRRVEYLRAWEDGTWDTTVERVQYDHSLEEQDIIAALTEWAYDHLATETRHRKVVFFGVMNETVREET